MKRIRDSQRNKNIYDKYAHQYEAMLESKDDVLSRELIIPALLNMAGDMKNLRVLDAGCGEGRITRMLYDRGAQVVGIDISGELLAIAKNKSDGRSIAFYCQDLCVDPPRRFQNTFDLIISNLVIDDLSDYKGFIKSVCSLAKHTARIIITKNNPYSAVSRDKVKSYFDSGTKTMYRGLSAKGVRVFYYHRTLEEHINEFSKYGFCLSTLSDLEPSRNLLSNTDPKIHTQFQRYLEIPFLMILEFSRIHHQKKHGRNTRKCK